MKKEEYSKVFIILCSLNITCLLISNIITIKTINILGLIFTAGDVLFPITYILNDVFTDIYGFNKSKLIIWTSFFCNLLMIIIFKITILLPSSDSFVMQEELANILGTTPRILCIIYSFFSWKFCKFNNNVKAESKNRRKIFSVKNYKFYFSWRSSRYINIYTNCIYK